MKLIYAGSFDPITRGHVDIIERGARLCDELIVAVLHNPAKQGCFTVPERLDMIRACTRHIANVRVDSYDGMLVDYLRVTGADAVLRGLRSGSDFESERGYDALNKELYPGAEEIYLMTRKELGFVSSSAVREIAPFGADISSLVPDEILDRVKARFAK